ncbi:hypothetical protein [Lentzea sp. NPDC059081]|uniref:hypothetical protein n=1 Tax=Lentzea sp. NPDC059081 TaxID=3346719 RepID=UPI0036B68A77
MTEPNNLLRAARERTPSRVAPGEPMSRRELAEAVNRWLWVTTAERYELDAHSIGRWERGAVRWPGAHYRAALRSVLSAETDADLGFRPAGAVAAGQALTPAPVTRTEPWTIADTLTRASIDGVALDHMARAVYGLAERYPSTPPQELWPTVSGLLTRLNDALGHPQPQRVRRQAVILLGVLSGIAGSLWVDFSRRDQAAAYFDVAELAAREAESPDLAAWALATRSVDAFAAGDTRSAVTLLARAEHEATGSGPRRRAWVSAMRARAAAAHGDPVTSARALEAAYRHVEAITEPPGGTEFFDLPRLDGVAGTTYLLLRDTARARPLLTGALQRRAPEDVKGRALLGLDLAECALVEGDPVEAGQVAIAALDQVGNALVEPIVVRARALSASVNHVAGARAVLKLDARLLEATRAR